MSGPDRAEKTTLGSLRAPLRVCAIVLFAQLCLTLFNAMDTAHQPALWDSPGKNTGEGCLALLQGIFLTQGLHLCLLHLLPYWQILYC